MQGRERVTAIIVVGVIVVLAMLIHSLTSGDRADLDTAGDAGGVISWTDVRIPGEAANDLDSAR